MKKLKYYLLLGYLMISNNTFAQSTGDAKGKINEILANYVGPAFVLGLVGAAIYGLIKNFDSIEDKEGLGTRTKGIQNVGWILLYAFIAEIVLVAIVAIGNLALRGLKIG